MSDKIKSSYFKNLYQDADGRLVVYHQQVHPTLEAALEQARDRDGWKYVHTLDELPLK